MIKNPLKPTKKPRICELLLVWLISVPKSYGSCWVFPRLTTGTDFIDVYIYGILFSWKQAQSMNPIGHAKYCQASWHIRMEILHEDYLSYISHGRSKSLHFKRGFLKFQGHNFSLINTPIKDIPNQTKPKQNNTKEKCIEDNIGAFMICFYLAQLKQL